MSTLKEIAANSQAYINNLPDNIDRVLNSPQIEEQLTQLNRKQLLSSVGNDGAQLIHKKTGSEYLSKPYAKRKHKKKPNIKDTGDYQSKMVTRSHYGKKQYYQKSNDWKKKYLPGNYTNMHGIAPANRPVAQEITGKAIANDYKSKVFK